LPALEYERGAQRRTHGDVTCTCLGVSSFRQILITAGTQLIGCYHVDVLERIKKQVGLVEELAGELEAEGSYRGLERLIQLTIQALLDLGLMVIAALGHGRPRAYSEIGYLLRELGVLGERAHPHLRLVGGGLTAPPVLLWGRSGVMGSTPYGASLPPWSSALSCLPHLRSTPASCRPCTRSLPPQKRAPLSKSPTTLLQLTSINFCKHPLPQLSKKLGTHVDTFTCNDTNI